MSMMRIFLSDDALQSDWGMLKLITGTGIDGQVYTVPLMQHYGFSSMPLTDAMALVDIEGSQTCAIASDSVKRPILQKGEVCLYIDKDTQILLQPDGTTTLKNAKATISMGSSGDVDLSTGGGSVHIDGSSGQVSLQNGNLTVDK